MLLYIILPVVCSFASLRRFAPFVFNVLIRRKTQISQGRTWQMRKGLFNEKESEESADELLPLRLVSSLTSPFNEKNHALLIQIHILSPLTKLGDVLTA